MCVPNFETSPLREQKMNSLQKNLNVVAVRVWSKISWSKYLTRLRDSAPQSASIAKVWADSSFTEAIHVLASTPSGRVGLSS